MISVAQSPRFLWALEKRIRMNPELAERYREKLQEFIRDPYAPSLKTHKLHGRLKDLWAFSLTHNLRIAFYSMDASHVVFEDLGTHDEIY
jgi:mRNA-degrading endonuclease YafQ of YafQ-DinJ toxin-antitoxin module